MAMRTPGPGPTSPWRIPPPGGPIHRPTASPHRSGDRGRPPSPRWSSARPARAHRHRPDRQRGVDPAARRHRRARGGALLPGELQLHLLGMGPGVSCSPSASSGCLTPRWWRRAPTTVRPRCPRRRVDRGGTTPGAHRQPWASGPATPATARSTPTTAVPRGRRDRDASGSCSGSPTPGAAGRRRCSTPSPASGRPPVCTCCSPRHPRRADDRGRRPAASRRRDPSRRR